MIKLKSDIEYLQSKNLFKSLVPNKKKKNIQMTSILVLICYKDTFDDASFSIWDGKGPVAVKDLYADNVFSSFTQLKEKKATQPSNNGTMSE